MSGQAGCYYFDRRPIDKQLVGIFDHDLVRHGPDGGAHYSAPGLLMLHRACHFDSLSELEKQPYCNLHGLVITFDGRLDNRADLLIWLRDTVSGEITDVALAAAAYTRWGEQGFARLIGDWSLSLWDQNNQALVLASDYCGVRPLYYRVHDGVGIYWSSSLQTLIHWPNSAEDLDESWIAAHLTARPRFDRTIYRSIRTVPPAHSMRVSAERSTVTRFWSPALRNTIRYEDDRLYEEELLGHFREAVAVRLRSNRPVSCDLTGGLDSSSVTCMAHELTDSGTVQARRIVAFTEVDHSSEDALYARLVQRRLGVRHVCCDMQSVWSFDPGQVTPSSSIPRIRLRATLLLEEGVRVNLTGIPGDLIMGNELDDCGQIADAIYNWRFAQFLIGAYRWSRALRIPIYQVIRKGLVPFLRPERQRMAWKKQSFAQGNLYAHAERRRSCFTSKVLGQLDDGWASDLDLCRWYDASPGTRKFLAMLEFQNLSRNLETPGDLQPINNSHPYTHRPLVEYMRAIPRDRLCGPGERRRLMRRAFADLLPHEVAKRKTKALMGYQYYTEAQELIQRLPADASDWEVSKRGWVEAPVLSETLSRIARGTLHEWSEITKVLTLETWCRPRGTGTPTPSYRTASSNTNVTANTEGR